jgi:ubiquinone/menaquinone biosynthesis C-methylase UbiE
MTLSFDAIAGQFDGQRGLPVAALRAIGAFMAGPPLEVIEPGVGTGRIALPIAMAGHRVTGVDVSRPMLDACRAKAGALRLTDRISLVEGDATALPVADSSCDAGVIASLLYLVPDWERVLDELHRVVRPGGRVLLVRERTEEGEALQRWDATWREMIEGTGFRHQPLAPTDEEIIAAMEARWGAVRTHTAAWSFGQTVAEARQDYGDRLRPLYAALDVATWQRTVADFLAWTEATFHDPGITLAGLVHFEIIEAIAEEHGAS